MASPLFKKLGLKDGCKICLINAPKNYWTHFDLLPDGIEQINELAKADVIHIFSKKEEYYLKQLNQCKDQMQQDTSIWVSWPKKASKVETELDFGIIQRAALDIGLVDNKVCSFSEIWSGLRFTIPIKDRK